MTLDYMETQNMFENARTVRDKSQKNLATEVMPYAQKIQTELKEHTLSDGRRFVICSLAEPTITQCEIT